MISFGALLNSGSMFEVAGAFDVVAPDVAELFVSRRTFNCEGLFDVGNVGDRGGVVVKLKSNIVF